MEPILNIQSPQAILSGVQAVLPDGTQGVIAPGAGVTEILLANNMDITKLRTNAPTLLPKMSGEAIDAAILRVTRQRMNMLADLRNAGLVRPNGGFGTMVSTYQRISDVGQATVSMLPETNVTRQRQEFDYVSVPVPCISSSFSLNIRDLAASRASGVPLDTTGAEVATRKVVEAIEDMISNGNSLKIGGNAIYGYRTANDRLTANATGSWHDPISGVANIRTTFAAALAALAAVNHFGPFTVYVATAEFELLEMPLDTTTYSLSIGEYLKKNPRIAAIKPTMAMPAGQCVFVELVSDTVDLSMGVEVQMIPWNEFGGLVSHYLVLGCMVPRIKSDFTNQCGVCHVSALNS